MMEFEASRECCGRMLIARALILDAGIQISVSGGDLAHIGAVSIVDPQGAVSTTEFPTHREGIVAEAWANALAEAGFRPAVVSAGIHYDGATREQIGQILAASQALLTDTLSQLQARRSPGA